ncbi:MULTISPECIES: lamin tail domain-containing protein [Sphingobacterium]|uniref:Lamin tail domain-containing protein n=1 Tax=Sphingobacterium populi TaxID=1812824 RepID=A0ABW5UDB0_9SPHI|nr:lamin tail domain-containing protein [Sphingobacterium sp. CFCC 11742]
MKAIVTLCSLYLLCCTSCTTFLEEESTYIAPHPIINEIMMNPSGNDLPMREWLELYNPSSIAISLKNYTITYNNRTFQFPDLYLPARQYIIVTSAQNEQAFMRYGNVCGIVGWPTMSNAGATITLAHDQIGTVDQVSYAANWYATAAKRRGGWSLERVNPEFGCNPARAWQESEAREGGTPGARNSVYRAGAIPNVQILRTIIQDQQLHFILNMDVGSIINIQQVQMPIELPQIHSWSISRDTIQLSFNQPLPVGIPYDVAITSEFCGRNVILSQTVFQEAHLLYNDVVINEVLFNPYTGSPSFVEIYNRSAKMMNLQGWRLGNRVISTQQLLFPPSSYRVITTNPEQLQKDYPSAMLRDVIVLPSLPAYANLQGIVTLFSPTGLMDSLRYTAAMHQPFIRNARGVSLERISPAAPTNEAGNFISTSTYSEGATPGYENSRFRAGTITKNNVYLAARILNPNSDGDDRFLSIHYEFIAENTMINLTIYDDRGRPINRLVRNRGVGYTGRFIWDGIREDGKPASSGVYIMSMETYHDNGQRQTFKESFLLRN